MRIEVAPYDAHWPMRFGRIRAELEWALVGVPVRAIEHVGSTSVVGLAAKPVIDVDVVVDAGAVAAVIGALEAAGYRHHGDLGIPERHAMAPPPDGLRRNVYVVVDGSVALRNHLAVRAALRADPEMRAAYGELKMRLAASVETMSDYVQRKTEFLVDILAEAGFTDLELHAIRDANAPHGRAEGASGTCRT